MSSMYVRSVGFWAPGFADAQSFCSGVVDANEEAPSAPLLRRSLRRRATNQTRAAVDVLGQVLSAADWDGSRVATVWGTAHGEHATSIAMFELMTRGEGKLSPTQFHNSVHNTAGGYASIAAKNTSTSTTLTGAGELIASGFVEASALLRSDFEEVALVFFDEPLRAPFQVSGMESMVAVGFGLTSRAEGALAEIAKIERTGTEGIRPPPGFGGMHVAASIPLLEKIVAAQPGSVALQIDTEPGPIWSASVEPM